MFNGNVCLNLLKSNTAWSFILSFMITDKNWPFLILYDKCWMSSCTPCQIRKTETSIDLIDLLGLLSIMVWISPKNSGIISEASKMLCLCNHNWTHPTRFKSSVRIQIYTQTNLHIVAFCSSNATNNLTSKKQKVCTLCYRHVETRWRKGHKRCDLFFGGKHNKSTWSGEIWWA